MGARIESAGWLYTAVVLIFLLLQTDFGVLALRRCHSLRRNNASSGVRIFFHCRVWYHKEPCATVFAYCERKNMYFCTKQLHENVSFDTRSLKSCCTLWMDSPMVGWCRWSFWDFGEITHLVSTITIRCRYSFRYFSPEMNELERADVI